MFVVFSGSFLPVDTPVRCIIICCNPSWASWLMTKQGNLLEVYGSEARQIQCNRTVTRFVCSGCILTWGPWQHSFLYIINPSSFCKVQRLSKKVQQNIVDYGMCTHS